MPMRTSQNVPSRISNETFPGSGGGVAGLPDAETRAASATGLGAANGGGEITGGSAAASGACDSRISWINSGGTIGSDGITGSGGKTVGGSDAGAVAGLGSGLDGATGVAVGIPQTPGAISSKGDQIGRASCRER